MLDIAACLSAPSSMFGSLGARGVSVVAVVAGAGDGVAGALLVAVPDEGAGAEGVEVG